MSESPQKSVTLSQPQYDFITSTAPVTLFSAGIGSGKSFVGSLWCKDQLALEPKARGFIAANTYSQLQNATLATFFATLDEYNIPWSYNQKFNVIKAAGRTIYAYSLDRFDNLRGIEIGWGWL